MYVYKELDFLLFVVISRCAVLSDVWFSFSHLFVCVWLFTWIFLFINLVKEMWDYRMGFHFVLVWGLEEVKEVST